MTSLSAMPVNRRCGFLRFLHQGDGERVRGRAGHEKQWDGGVRKDLKYLAFSNIWRIFATH